jgi:putative ABC transport system permease protein
MRGIGGDIKFAFKQAWKNPGLVLVITIILGIGIGVNTTIFSLTTAPFNIPVRDPLRVITLWSANSARAIDRSPVSGGDFADLKTNLRSLENLAASADDEAHLTGASEPVRATIRRVTLNFFPVLGRRRRPARRHPDRFHLADLV